MRWRRLGGWSRRSFNVGPEHRYRLLRKNVRQGRFQCQMGSQWRCKYGREVAKGQSTEDGPTRTETAADATDTAG